MGALEIDPILANQRPPDHVRSAGGGGGKETVSLKICAMAVQNKIEYVHQLTTRSLWCNVHGEFSRPSCYTHLRQRRCQEKFFQNTGIVLMSEPDRRCRALRSVSYDATAIFSIRAN